MTDISVPFVSIVVLAWNQCDFTVECLASLQQIDYPADRLQIIVVDNGSNDDTAPCICRLYPTVTVIRNSDNLGFAEGNNVGIREALNSPADYIMLLNNDTIVSDKMLSALISVAEACPTIGIVTPKIYYYKEPTRIWCAGASLNWSSGASLRLRADEEDSDPQTIVAPVDFASGCAMCLRRRAIEEIGLLDSRFFVYYEETDWCARARDAGWDILYVSDALVWHRVSGTIGSISPAIDYYMTRNVMLFLAKNLNGSPRWLKIAGVVGRNLLTITIYTVKQHSGARRPYRNARILGLRDALFGRWGRMHQDVEDALFR